MKIKSFNCTFLSDGDIMNLNRANIHTSEQMVTYADLDALSRKTQVSLKSLKMLKKFIIGQYAPFPQLASELLAKYVRSFFIIKFGCKRIDDLIMNGVYSNEITDINGISGNLFYNFLVRFFGQMSNRNPVKNIKYSPLSVSKTYLINIAQWLSIYPKI